MREALTKYKSVNMSESKQLYIIRLFNLLLTIFFLHRQGRRKKFVSFRGGKNRTLLFKYILSLHALGINELHIIAKTN